MRIYRELYYTPERPPSISEFYPRTIIVSGLSKSMRMTGWRIGWLAGDADSDESALGVARIRCYLRLEHFAKGRTRRRGRTKPPPHAKSTARSFTGRRDHLLSSLENVLGLRAIAPEGAFYTMVGRAPLWRRNARGEGRT
jgi:aspartate/methionine/tyrosine aminotransferase